MSVELERPTRRFTFRGGNAEAIACEDMEVLLESGAGTGKSFALMYKAHMAASMYPDARIVLLRKTRKSLNVILEDFERSILYPGHPALANGTAHYSNRSFYAYPNGSEIWLAGLDNPDKVMSAQFDRIFIIEATDGVTVTDLEYLKTRLRADRTPYHQIMCDCNPKHAGHWLNRRAELDYEVPPELEGIVPPARPGQKMMTRIRCRHEDNPKLWDNDKAEWTKFGAEYMTNLHQLTGHRRDRLLLHKWVSAEGLVYPEYDPETHLVNASLKRNEHGNWEIHYQGKAYRVHKFALGGDRGWTHAGSLQLGAIDVDGRIWIVQQAHHTQKKQSWWSDIMYGWWEEYGLWRGWFDSSEPEWIAHFNDRIGSRADRDANRCIRKANKAVMTGINEVKERLKVQPDGLPRLLVLQDSLCHPEDPELAEKFLPTSIEGEFESYSWKQIPDGKEYGKDEPEKEGDDSLDSLRYLVMGLYNRDKAPEEKPRAIKSVYQQDIEDVLGF